MQWRLCVGSSRCKGAIASVAGADTRPTGGAPGGYAPGVTGESRGCRSGAGRGRGEDARRTGRRGPRAGSAGRDWGRGTGLGGEGLVVGGYAAGGAVDGNQAAVGE